MVAGGSPRALTLLQHTSLVAISQSTVQSANIIVFLQQWREYSKKKQFSPKTIIVTKYYCQTITNSLEVTKYYCQNPTETGSRFKKPSTLRWNSLQSSPPLTDMFVLPRVLSTEVGRKYGVVFSSPDTVCLVVLWGGGTAPPTSPPTPPL